eukprot:gnl/MRDRNA2_/MRDRNA2_81151_c0_seq4.p1 gnl/MRDRNA2_/MRDRNA2_81151_c0~~gnl/MRDRNA2_/MRDRNA2_81151_c0_seq4.p1  ORF type:complete len:527 (+),score=88.67 gnl/MRDRNA2_/MRDRNA2_81151_c0_seq4:93-1673(+)
MPPKHTTGEQRLQRIAAQVLKSGPATATETHSTAGEVQHYDCIIVGAGFAGLYAIKRFADMGLSVRCFERGSDVGGTWYWNRYPGARCDMPSMQYSYQFDQQLQQEWEWTEKYSPQPEILKYISHVADRFRLRSHIQFDTEVTKMNFDSSSKQWKIETLCGGCFLASFCIMATGCLSQANEFEKKFEGVSDFLGEKYHTGQWPHEGKFGGKMPFENRNVAVIGTGSSGIQSIPEIAKIAKHLYVFQRTANYSIPAHNEPLNPELRKATKNQYSELRQRSHQSPVNFVSDVQVNKQTGRLDIPALPQMGQGKMISALSVSEQERNARYAEGWRRGGFDFPQFFDLAINEEANATCADFIRNKIRQTVKNPDTAELLCPRNFYGCKRLCVDSFYFETYNRPNVTLVDINKEHEGSTPIQRVTKDGILTSNGTEYKVDAIVFAIGYDSMVGAILNIDITGDAGQTMQQHWSDGPSCYMGLGMSGFPNLFTITGPGSPSVLTNMVPTIEHHVNWVANTIAHMKNHGPEVD